MTPLHDLNPVGRFGDRAADYVKYRPSYPADAIDLILEGSGEPDHLAAAYVPKTGELGGRFRRLLDALFERFVDTTGHVTLVYDTEVYRASRQ